MSLLERLFCKATAKYDNELMVRWKDIVQLLDEAAASHPCQKCLLREYGCKEWKCGNNQAQRKWFIEGFGGGDTGPVSDEKCLTCLGFLEEMPEVARHFIPRCQCYGRENCGIKAKLEASSSAGPAKPSLHHVLVLKVKEGRRLVGFWKEEIPVNSDTAKWLEENWANIELERLDSSVNIKKGSEEKSSSAEKED